MLAVLAFYLLNSCIDPVTPNFEYREGLLYIEAFAGSTPGSSFVAISVSANEFGVNVVNFMEGASVLFLEGATGRQVELNEIGEAYVPPEDFVATPGESWRLDVRLADGRHYISDFEEVADPVPLTGIRAVFKPQLLFREPSGKFIPGHEVLVDFTDPDAKDNYYYYRYRAFEHLELCEKCNFGIFRDGACVGPAQGTFVEDYYDYTCQTECWKIRYPEEINIFDDRFINGQFVNALAVASLPLYTKEDMVVEIQQLALTPKAFDYYKVIKDIVDNNSGFNAPPPAALIGNITNADDDEEAVFGRFTAAATAVAHVFIDRSGIEEETVDRPMRVIREGCEVCPPGSACLVGDCAPVATAQCSETRYRTAMMPPGWIEQ
jgi:hypothetical protein